MTENQKTFSGGEPVIRLIGLGETGVKLVETLAMIGPEGVESHSLDTDNRSLSRCHQSKTLLLGHAIPCGLGRGGDVALARAAVESDRDRLAKLVEGANLVFVIAGMGGGTGTGAASLVARLAKESGALVVGVAATPFDCEGTRRCNQATGGLRDLKQASDVVFHFSNQDVVQMTGADTSLNNALEIANRHLCESVLGVSRMLLEPGLLNVSFGDLQSAVQGRQRRPPFRPGATASSSAAALDSPAAAAASFHLAVARCAPPRQPVRRPHRPAGRRRRPRSRLLLALVDQL